MTDTDLNKSSCFSGVSRFVAKFCKLQSLLQIMICFLDVHKVRFHVDCNKQKNVLEPIDYKKKKHLFLTSFSTINTYTLETTKKHFTGILLQSRTHLRNLLAQRQN